MQYDCINFVFHLLAMKMAFHIFRCYLISLALILCGNRRNVAKPILQDTYACTSLLFGSMLIC